METVGTFEAKTHLTRLLGRVASGQRILITNRGKPVAMLVPPEIEPAKGAAEIGRAMLQYRDRAKRKLRGSFRAMAHQGHRY